MKKVAAYCRVSTDKDDQANSLENQKTYFDRYIKENKDWEFVEIYADEGISGTSTKNRDEFQRMIKDALNGKLDIILVKEISRFFRNVPRFIDYTRELKAKGVEIRFTNERISTFDNNSNLALNILATTAEEESRKISMRTKWGQKESMKKGIVFGNGLLGYNVKGGQLYINEEQAEIVRKIFNDYVYQEKGMYLICQDLMNNGYKTSKGNKTWIPSAIRTILTNEKYVGDLKQQKTYTEDPLTHKTIINKGEEEIVYIKNHHEPIVSRELFDKAQEELKIRGKNYQNSGNRYSNKYAFSGKIKCAHCGKKYSAGAKKILSSGEQIMQWRCYTRAVHGTKKTLTTGEIIGCNGVTMQDNILKEGFNKVYTEILKSFPNIEQKAISMVTKMINRRCKEDDKESKILKRKRDLEHEQEKLIELYMKDLITEEEFREKKIERESILKNLSAELEKISQKEQIMQNKEELLKEVQMQVKQILSVEQFNDEMFRELIDEIVIHNRNEIDYYVKGTKEKFFFETVGGFLYNKCGLIIKY